MCLSSVVFSLNYDEEEKEFVGIGYKLIEKQMAEKYKSDKWMCAKGNYGERHTPTTQLLSGDNKYYFPGFHIFLSKSDAANYSSRTNTKVLVEVKFKNVVSYGINEMYNNDSYGACIISKHMKLVKKFSKASLESLRV